MGPREVAQRLIDRAQADYWRIRYFGLRRVPARAPTTRTFVSGLPRASSGEAPAAARAQLLACADRLLTGAWPVFAVARTDVTADVDWHFDARNNTRAPANCYALDIAAGDNDASFDRKYVWELSRHHHTTVLAMAFWLTGEERYARAAAAQIESWARANPFLTGIHWSSGIEIAMRLIAFSWTRRLLEGWNRVRRHFDDNEKFAQTVFLHQWFLARRGSHGSSANNHLLYEMAGLYVSTCCMPWHARAAAWRQRAAQIFQRSFAAQIFDNGYSRELASDYNGFVLEALLLCLVEGEMSGHRLGTGSWGCARSMLDCLDEISDRRGNPARQGDSDDAVGLLLDGHGYDRWRDFAQLSRAWFGKPDGEPRYLRAWLFATVARPPSETPMPEPRAAPWSGAGLVVLRSRRAAAREIYCVFDTGPLGYLSIAAHGHADALAVELRYDGTPVLVDPGTYAYAGPWRDYFRSTAAHNTIELGGASQSRSGGPFLWTRHACTTLLGTEGLDEDASCAHAAAEHDGYVREIFCGSHRREVDLDRRSATLSIRDELSTKRTTLCRMFFHLHPEIDCNLVDATAELWCAGARIRMDLPQSLGWRELRGSDLPRSGWYSPSYDVRVPTTTLVGETMLDRAIILQTVLTFPRQV